MKSMAKVRMVLTILLVIAFGSVSANAGDILVINEIMNNPSAVEDIAGEWFEIYNPELTATDLNGWTIQDNDSDLHIIGNSVIVQAQGYVVLGIESDSNLNGGLQVDYAYTNISFGNAADELILINPSSVEIDRVEYDDGLSFPDPIGASMMLECDRMDTVENDAGENWSTSIIAFGDGDFGTPGADNCNPSGSVAKQVGDMDADGQISIKEAIIALQIATGIDPGIPLGTYVPATGDAVAADVLNGKTFSSSTGNEKTGTLVQHPMGQTYITPWYLLTFNLLPAGTFTMGSPDTEAGRDTDEGPQVATTISQPFYMMINEVTQWQWQAVVLAAEFWGHIGVDILDDAPSYFKESGGAIKPDNPVEYMSFEDVQTWVGLLNTLDGRAGCDGTDIHAACYRLPTEAEWEYAARAGTTTAYANPNNYDLTDPPETESGFNPNLATMGWYTWNGTNGGYPTGTKPVMRKQANSWGGYDMHGNVSEWCRDWYQSDYYSLTPPDRPATDPEGPSSGVTHRVFRGGNYNNLAKHARLANRFNSLPSIVYRGTGFRLVFPLGQ